jgi:hypothetical protein
MNHELITETCKTTVASLMLLASSPSRLTDLSLSGSSNGQAVITWTPSPENSVVSYQVVYGPPDHPTQHSLTVTGPRAVLPSATADSRVAVRATNSRGLHGWDWAYLSLAR